MTYQQLRAQLTLAKAAAQELSPADARYPSAAADVIRLTGLLKRFESAIGSATLPGGHLRPH
jgi:hypothetical protein